MIITHYPDETVSEEELSAWVDAEVISQLLSEQEGKVKLCVDIARRFEVEDDIDKSRQKCHRASLSANRIRTRVDLLLKWETRDLVALLRGYKP